MKGERLSSDRVECPNIPRGLKKKKKPSGSGIGCEGGESVGWKVYLGGFCLALG
jgi:hypothetical protein